MIGLNESEVIERGGKIGHFGNDKNINCQNFRWLLMKKNGEKSEKDNFVLVRYS